MGHLYHGYVSHNQRVDKWAYLTWHLSTLWWTQCYLLSTSTWMRFPWWIKRASIYDLWPLGHAQPASFFDKSQGIHGDSLPATKPSIESAQNQYGGFLKYGYPKPSVFPIDNNPFWMILGYHHFRKPPSAKSIIFHVASTRRRTSRSPPAARKLPESVR